MRVSQKCEYALRAVLELSLQPNELVKVAQIASRQGIPLKFLELILGNLREKGVVETRRGREGGCRLSCDPMQLTVAEVLALVGTDWGRGRSYEGPFADLWTEADNRVMSVLSGTTFAELAGKLRSTLPTTPSA